jgi:hypothetical protein
LSGDWTVPAGVEYIDVFCADGGSVETSDFCIGGNAGTITYALDVAINQEATINLKTGSEGADNATSLPDCIAFLENRLRQETDGALTNTVHEKIIDALQQYKGKISAGSPEGGDLKNSPGVVIIHYRKE